MEHATEPEPNRDAEPVAAGGVDPAATDPTTETPDAGEIDATDVDDETEADQDGLFVAFLVGLFLLLTLCVALTVIAANRAPG